MHTSPSTPRSLPAGCPLKFRLWLVTPEHPAQPQRRTSTRSTVPTRLDSASLAIAASISLVEFGEARRLRFLRNLDAVLRYPVSMGLGLDNRLESVAYAHTAADLHVRLRYQNRAGLRSWAPRAS